MIEAPVREVPVEPANPAEPTTKPKLSELMRLGAIAVGKQGKRQYVYYKKTTDPQISSVCALGAVIVGAGQGDVFLTNPHKQIAYSGIANDLVNEHVDRDLAEPPAVCCDHQFRCLSARHGGVSGTIIHLNDDHKMPIREIAEYLQSQGL